MPAVSAIVVAAGRGVRLGEGARKAFRQLAGRALVEWSLEALAAVEEIAEIVLVLHEGDFARGPKGFAKGPTDYRVKALVRGGEERFDSVLAGLRAVSPGIDLVLVHDAARPFVRPETIRAVIAAADRAGGAIAAVPSTDTLKGVDKEGRVLGTFGRDAVWRAQTPQVFRRTPFVAAMEQAAKGGEKPTDDAAVAEAAGMSVVVVPGDETNLKITTAADLSFAEHLISLRHGNRK